MISADPIELIDRLINYMIMAAETPTQRRIRKPGRPRQAEGEGEAGAVRDRLLDAAMELASEQGFEACGLREIAARAEVSSAMIAYYFGDRSGLYEAMFRRAFDRIREQVEALLADPERVGGDRLQELVRLQVEAIAADPWLPNLIVREVLLPGESASRDFFVKSVGAGPLMLLVRWLEEEQERQVLRSDFDPRMMAMTIISLSAFPYLMLPIVGAEIDLEIDADFPNRLIRHNQKLLSLGLRTGSEEER
ncbi:MAG TPA: TetR/AcrR family transcriptional regulator [Myxococcales bacterium]|nr:TetR/AcrR family transcriptional regulator [Myxococcales bacterium]HIK85386.1 TetR/AcrR family transcriptional regulator [Myxococcales bacterium]